MNVETLDCDVCGAKIADFESDLFHYSGKLRGKKSTHIHLCAKCESDLKPPFFDFDEAIKCRALLELAMKYNKKTDDYDKVVCSRTNIHGEPVPISQNEKFLVHKNAREVLGEVCKEARLFDISPAELLRAISKG